MTQTVGRSCATGFRAPARCVVRVQADVARPRRHRAAAVAGQPRSQQLGKLQHWRLARETRASAAQRVRWRFTGKIRRGRDSRHRLCRLQPALAERALREEAAATSGHSAGSLLGSANVVPPPPGLGGGKALSGSGRGNKGTGAGGPLDLGSSVAPPSNAGGNAAGNGVVISSQPGTKAGLPNSDRRWRARDVTQWHSQKRPRRKRRRSGHRQRQRLRQRIARRRVRRGKRRRRTRIRSQRPRRDLAVSRPRRRGHPAPAARPPYPAYPCKAARPRSPCPVSELPAAMRRPRARPLFDQRSQRIGNHRRSDLQLRRRLQLLRH